MLKETSLPAVAKELKIFALLEKYTKKQTGVIADIYKN